MPLALLARRGGPRCVLHKDGPLVGKQQNHMLWDALPRVFLLLFLSRVGCLKTEMLGVLSFHVRDTLPPVSLTLEPKLALGAGGDSPTHNRYLHNRGTAPNLLRP